jgi:polyhydroxyalkanoate synthesis regulator phasin
MPKRKAQTKRQKAGTRGRTSARPADVVKGTWAATLEALGSAEAEVEKQIRGLLRRNRISLPDAKRVLQQLGNRVDRERKRAARDIEGGLREVQKKVEQERSNLRRIANDAVQSALATFNIPNRREVTDLTRKVQELSRKIDALGRKPVARRRARA